MKSDDKNGTTDRQLQPNIADEGVCIDLHATWAEFVEALGQYCSKRGWELEYESVEDESCAIFWQPN